MSEWWTEFIGEIRKFKKTERLKVIGHLDMAVEEDNISQETADRILLEWDVSRWPKQVPRPLREHTREHLLYIRSDEPCLPNEKSK